MFFHEEYSFKGKHARYVKILKNSFPVFLEIVLVLWRSDESVWV